MGAPLGNKNGQLGREFREALRYALAQEYPGKAERGSALKKVAIKLVDNALEGNFQAVQEVANRLDGKPTQAIEMNGSMGLVEFVAQLERIRKADASPLPVDNPAIEQEKHVTH